MGMTVQQSKILAMRVTVPDDAGQQLLSKESIQAAGYCRRITSRFKHRDDSFDGTGVLVSCGRAADCAQIREPKLLAFCVRVEPLDHVARVII